MTTINREVFDKNGELKEEVRTLMDRTGMLSAVDGWAWLADIYSKHGNCSPEELFDRADLHNEYTVVIFTRDHPAFEKIEPVEDV